MLELTVSLDEAEDMLDENTARNGNNSTKFSAAFIYNFSSLKLQPISNNTHPL